MELEKGNKSRMREQRGQDLNTNETQERADEHRWETKQEQETDSRKDHWKAK